MPTKKPETTKSDTAPDSPGPENRIFTGAVVIDKNLVELIYEGQTENEYRRLTIRLNHTRYFLLKIETGMYAVSVDGYEYRFINRETAESAYRAVVGNVR